jgi:sulfur carrier protein
LQSIEISVNGEIAKIPAACSVLRLLAELGIRDDRVAVELNRQIVHKRDWETTLVVSGAQVEIVEFVGGG